MTLQGIKYAALVMLIIVAMVAVTLFTAVFCPILRLMAIGVLIFILLAWAFS